MYGGGGGIEKSCNPSEWEIDDFGNQKGTEHRYLWYTFEVM
jgi:hypothetical protein